MTDNEIIKALENEIHIVEYVDGFSVDNVSLELLQNSLDLINRQQTEIEKLKTKEMFQTRHLGVFPNVIKSEVIKEFIDRLRERLVSKAIDNYRNNNENGYYLSRCVLDEIDNLVKEMVGDTE